jgi:hypothetical protein
MMKVAGVDGKIAAGDRHILHLASSGADRGSNGRFLVIA